MEILLNGEFYKAEFCTSRRIKFIKLNTLQKLLIENWFKDAIEEGGQMKKSSDIKIDIGAVMDTQLIVLKGVFPSQVGDSSEDFQLSYDSLEFKIRLFPDYVKGYTVGHDNKRAGVIPNFG